VDIHATMYHCMGLEPATTLYDPLKRPFPLCTGKVIPGLV
jgi:hypothetical protein